MKYRTRLGRREATFTTFGSRWGAGKVHRYVWDPLNRLWYVQCCEVGRDPYGRATDRDLVVTCRKCLSGPRR